MELFKVSVKFKELLIEKCKETIALGGKHIVQYTDDVLKECTPETYIIVLTIVTPINLI